MPRRLSLLFSAVLMFARTAICDTSLSPATWPEGEFERLEKMTLNRFERPKPLAVSPGRGLVAGTTEPLAVHSGMDALRKGGSAMDACLATALTGIKTSIKPTTPNNTQHVATHRNTVAKRTQHAAPNNVGICCVGMLRSFGRGLMEEHS